MSRKKNKNKKKSGNQKQKINVKLKLDKGVGFHKNGALKDALKIYMEILDVYPGNSDVLYLSGAVYHQRGDDERAVKMIQQAIYINGSNPEYYRTLSRAFNNLGLTLQENGEKEKALDAYNKALEIDSNFHLALNNAGLIYQSLKEYTLSEKFYKKAIKADPLFYEAWVNLGYVLQIQALFEEALSCYDKALNINPEAWQVYNNSGLIFKQHKDYELSINYFQKAVELYSGYCEAYYNLGCCYQENNNAEQAVAEYEKAIDCNPKYETAFQNLGNVLMELGRWSDALSQYEKVLSLNPGNAAVYNNIGNLYQRQHDFDTALAYIAKAIDLLPDSAEFNNNYGIALKKKGDMNNAEHFFKKAISLNPKYEGVFYHLGDVYRIGNQFRKAAKSYEKAIELDVDFESAYDHLAYSYQRLCAWDDALKYQKIISELTRKAIATGAQVTETPHNCLLRWDDPELCYLVAKSKSDGVQRDVAGSAEIFTFEKRRVDKAELRIGYISNTFSDHPGGHLIAGLFGCHDRDKISTFCYSYGQDDKSYYRKKVEEESDKFVDISKLSDREAATLIFNDEIDILVDLRGDTGGSRTRICAMKPAPVQVVYLGFPGTSGATFYDYLIADKTVVPEHHRRYFSETIVYMPDCYQVNNNEQVISDKRFSRKEAGLSDDAFVYCCFNTEYKIEPVMFDCWMRILQRVPGSVLWLLKSGNEMEQNLIREADQRGIDSRRLVFSDYLPKDQHLKRCQLADLALDTRIVNGHTSTTDMLWAGLPVVALNGNHFASKVSASLLASAGLPELIAENLTAYEELAVTLANDKDAHEDLRRRTLENRLTAPLFNTPLFTENLEKAYELMWQLFLNDTKQEAIHV